MSGKNQRVRRVAVGFLVLLVLAVSAQAAALQRVAPSAAELFDRVVPASVRAWLFAHEGAHRAPRRPLPLKCGGTIDPNGSPCPPHPACAGCG